MQIKKKGPLTSNSNTMSEIFESYEEEFRGVATDCQKKISDVMTYETNAGKYKKKQIMSYLHSIPNNRLTFMPLTVYTQIRSDKYYDRLNLKFNSWKAW